MARAAPPPPEPRPPVAYTSEGGGTVATCTACDWAAWKATRGEAQTTAAGHTKCLKGNVELVNRRKRSAQLQRIYNL